MAAVKWNYHTHSNYSDGTAPLQDYVDEAERQGLKYLGFAEHYPLPFQNTFALQPDKVKEYVNRVKVLRSQPSPPSAEPEKCSFPILFAGAEIDYIPGISEGFAAIKKQYGFDFIIGSVHLVMNPEADGLWFIDGPSRQMYDDGLQFYFGGDIRKAVTAYYRQIQQMIREEKMDVLGHFDKIKMHNQNRFFIEEESWYQRLLMETLEEIVAAGIVVEVNTRGLYKKRSDDLFPGFEVLKQMNIKQVPVILSSDAHAPTELIALFDEGLDTIKLAGFSSISCFTQHGWQQLDIKALL